MSEAIEWIKKKYDIEDSYSQKEAVRFDVDKPEDSRVIAIIGESGTGKTTLLKKWFPRQDIEFNFDANKSIFELINDYVGDYEKTSKLLFDVGLASVTMWQNLPSELSNGEKMRFQLAYKLVNSDKSIFIDEFTSMLDRQTAKNLCKNLNRLIEEYDKQIVLSTCHFDFIEWIDTDFIVDTNAKKAMRVESEVNMSVSKWKSIVYQSMLGEHLASITI